MKIAKLGIFKSSNILLLALLLFCLLGDRPSWTQFVATAILPPLTIDHRWWSSWMNHKSHIIISECPESAWIRGWNEKDSFRLVFFWYFLFLIFFNIRFVYKKNMWMDSWIFGLTTLDSKESLSSFQISFRFPSDSSAIRLGLDTRTWVHQLNTTGYRFTKRFLWQTAIFNRVRRSVQVRERRWSLFIIE